MYIKRFMKHAADRVRLGDENGLRTTLTLDDIANIIEKGLFAYYGNNCVLYSKKDKKFLAVVIVKRIVLTVKPADRIPIKYRALAISRLAGQLPPLQLKYSD